MDEAKKEPQIWIDRIRRTEKINREKKKETIRLKRAYMGDFTNSAGYDVSKYTLKINFVYYFVETIMAAIFSGDPKVTARPKKDPSLQNAADLLAYNTNYWSRELDAKSEFKDAIFDSFYGPAAIYTGWTYEVEKNKVKSIDPVTGAEIEVEEEKVVKDEPLIRWLDFWNEVRVDPDVLRTRRARWMAIRITVPHPEFLENETIKEEYRFGEKALKPKQRPEDMVDDSPYQNDRNHIPSDSEWITYWEVWDREKMQRKYVHEECPDEFLNAGSLDWPFWIEVQNDEFPITILHAKNDPFGPMSFSELKAVEDQIWERVRLRSVQAAIVRRSAPKYLFQKGAGTKEQIKKLLTSDILSANELNDINKFRVMPAPEISQGFYQWDSQLSDDLGNVSGLAEFQNNRLANTATEASIAEGRSNMRAKERIDKIEDFVVAVLTKIGQLCQQLQVRAETFVINPEEFLDSAPQVFNVSKEQIQGEFDFSILAGSMEHQNIETEKRDLLKFRELAAQTGNANIDYIDRRLAYLMNLDVRKVLLTEEEKADRARMGAEPTLTFDKIKLEDLSPVDRVRVIETAKAENNIQSLSPEPREAAEASLSMLGGEQNQQAATSMPENQSFNMAGNRNPSVPVHPASMGNER